MAVKKWCSHETIIHINVPNKNSFHLLWGLEAQLIKGLDVMTETGKLYQRHSVFNLETLQNLIEECGFKCMEKGSYFLKIFNNTKMLRLIKESYIDEGLLDGLNKLTKYFPNNGSEIFVNCRVINE